ncbi:MAG: UDP-N-acetylmuramate--L-alanine ligase [Polyangiales bacterium]
MFRGRVRHVHFVGAGGIGMSGLAEILRSLDFDVSGSDLKPSDVTRRLQSLGVVVHIGHRAEHVKGTDVVVISSAVKNDNPEVLEARTRQIPVIARAEMLAELMRLKHGVAIAGSHGKTTTTSLVSAVLRAAGLDPTVVVGGKVNALGSNARLGQGDILVAEADESDGSFLRLTPTIAVVTNIDPEHLDHYGTFDALKAAFVAFVERIPFYGLGVLCLDHPHVQAILPQVQRRHVTYGLSAQADYRATHATFSGLETKFEVFRRNERLGDFVVRMPGAHNVLNTLAAIAVADELEVPLDVVRSALASFSGVQRRFTIVGEAFGVTVVDDYGHHPAEIEATLEAARQAFDRRIVVAVQPHRYSRTQALQGEFARAFNRADVVIITEIYAAGEEPIQGVSGSALAESVRAHGHHDVSFVPTREGVTDALTSIVRPSDLVICLGAGDINKCTGELLERLKRRSPRALDLAGRGPQGSSDDGGAS